MDSDVVIAVLLVLGALIHLPPLLGVIGVPVLEGAYGIRIEGPDLALLLRHRAVLFGLLGGLMVWAALDHDLRAPAIISGLVSDVAFAGLCLVHRDHNAALGKVLRLDLISIVVLAAAGLIAL